MKILKKISLIIIGILLSLVILETCLQIASFTLITIKKYRNKTIKAPNTVTILCLGESTTDGQWPPILQKILNEKSKNKKFNVIDEGIVGTNTKLIAKKIKQNLLKYNPNIIISMIGINDAGLGYKQYRIKILNLIQLIIFHITTHYFYTDASFFEIDAECMDLRKKFNFSSVKRKYYKLFKKSDFSDKLAYFRLWELINFTKEIDVQFYDALLKYDKIFITSLTLEYILKYLSVYKNYNKEEIKNFLIKNINRILFSENIEKILKEYDCLFIIQDIQNNKEQTYKFKVTNLLNEKNRTENYLYIIKETNKFNNNILFIAMQYPTLSVEQLKNDLKNSPYYDKLIFVSNEENFKQALQKYKTEDIFVDMFGGSFGHCTELGNTIIAENVAETILKLYN